MEKGNPLLAMIERHYSMMAHTVAVEQASAMQVPLMEAKLVDFGGDAGLDHLVFYSPSYS